MTLPSESSSVLASVLNHDTTIAPSSEQSFAKQPVKKNSRSFANDKQSYFNTIKKRAKKEQLRHIQNKITKFEFWFIKAYEIIFLFNFNLSLT